MEFEYKKGKKINAYIWDIVVSYKIVPFSLDLQETHGS